MALTFAVGGIMIYAKTKVEPPIALKQVNQYSIDITNSCKAVTQAENDSKVDSIYTTVMDRINVFKNEDKIQPSEADKCMDLFIKNYTPLFMSHCFGEFQQSVWNANDHTDMLSHISKLKVLTHSDNSSVLASSTIDSLNLISKIIADYRQARKISRYTSFTGVSNALSVITQAKQYTNNSYLANCRDLHSELQNVRLSIAQSHYNFVTAQVEKLSQYKFYSKSYYEGTLIPHVDAVTTEYDNKAASLYGSKKDVNYLWNRARNYYDEAMSYYGAN